MSQITVKRIKAHWVDRARNYGILVDGKEVAEIGNDSEVAIDVDPGAHKVQLKIDWCRSPVIDIEVSQGKTVYLECGPRAHPALVLLYITVWKDKYIWVRKA
ncbi:MAG: hypothetical protein D5S03_13415 [Desulfonatronospira sp. MSAO_Bac3]|nr:MAG: hypothetical protein D5S03_13415 [Desulfonatronospira sp. MSAO_Bac3]